jgi:hypothetical protein
MLPVHYSQPTNNYLVSRCSCQVGTTFSYQDDRQAVALTVPPGQLSTLVLGVGIGVGLTVLAVIALQDG